MEIQYVLNVTSGLIGWASVSAFAFQIHRMKLHVNLATWGMILLLDVIGLALVILSGNKEPFIQAGWTLAAIFVFIAACVNRGNWEWTLVETFSLVCCVVSIAVWIMSGSAWSLLAYVFAGYFSAIPQAKQYWLDHVEARKSAWLWVVSCFALALAIFGIPSFSPEYSVVPVGFLLLNVAMSWITLRKSAPQVVLRD